MMHAYPPEGSRTPSGLGDFGLVRAACGNTVVTERCTDNQGRVTCHACLKVLKNVGSPPSPPDEKRLTEGEWRDAVHGLKSTFVNTKELCQTWCNCVLPSGRATRFKEQITCEGCLQELEKSSDGAQAVEDKEPLRQAMEDYMSGTKWYISSTGMSPRYIPSPDLEHRDKLLRIAMEIVRGDCLEKVPPTEPELKSYRLKLYLSACDFLTKELSSWRNAETAEYDFLGRAARNG